MSGFHNFPGINRSSQHRSDGLDELLNFDFQSLNSVKKAEPSDYDALCSASSVTTNKSGNVPRSLARTNKTQDLTKIQNGSGDLDELLNFNFQAFNSFKKELPPQKAHTQSSVLPKQNPGNQNELVNSDRNPASVAKQRRYPTPSKDINKTVLAESISVEDWCNGNLSGSLNSWTKHFTEVNSSKPNNFPNPTPLSNSVLSDKLKNTDGNATVADNQMKDEDKETAQYLSRKLKDDMVNFKSMYKFDKLHFICKICNITLRPDMVVPHSNTLAHLNYSKQNLSYAKMDVTKKDSLSARSSRVSSPSFHTFQNNIRSTELKSTKPNRFPNPTPVSNSALYDKSKNIDTDGNATVTGMANQLKDEDKEISQYLSHELKHDMDNFIPTYTFDKLNFICKVCNLTLRPDKVVPHSNSLAHLNCLKNLCNSKMGATSKSNHSSKSSRVSPFTQKESRQMFNKIAEDLNKEDNKVVESLEQDSAHILNSFERSSGSNDSLTFICKVCKLSLSPKYANSHMHSCSRKEDLRKNHTLVNLEDLKYNNNKIMKEVLNAVNYRLFFFEMFFENNSDRLGFFCNVCHVALAPVDVSNHISSSAHSENLLSNPFSLEFESLNMANKHIVKGLAAAIKDRMKDFCLLYKTGTEELRFYCKFCVAPLTPEKVKEHCRLSVHLKHVHAKQSGKGEIFGGFNSNQKLPNRDMSSGRVLPPKVTPNLSQSSSSTSNPRSQSLKVVGFNLLTGSQKETVKKLALESKIELISFDFLSSVSNNKFYIICKPCHVTFNPELLSGHVKSADHFHNVKLSGIFNNFGFLEESSKNILRDLFGKFESKLGVFTLTEDNGNKLKCKSCSATVSLEMEKTEWLENHFQCKNLPVTANKNASNLSKKPHIKPFSQFNIETAIHKTAESCCLSSSTDGTRSNIDETSLEKPNQKPIPKPRKKKLSCKTESNTPFNCRNCDVTLNFNSEEQHGLRQEQRALLITNCCGKSAKNILLSREKRKVCNSDASHNAPSYVSTSGDNSEESEPEVLSESNKRALKMLIDQIGMKINDFEPFFTKTSSSALEPELRLKCKFCCISLHPEAVLQHTYAGCSQVDSFSVMDSESQSSGSSSSSSVPAKKDYTMPEPSNMLSNHQEKTAEPKTMNNPGAFRNTPRKTSSENSCSLM